MGLGGFADRQTLLTSTKNRGLSNTKSWKGTVLIFVGVKRRGTGRSYVGLCSLYSNSLVKSINFVLELDILTKCLNIFMSQNWIWKCWEEKNKLENCNGWLCKNSFYTSSHPWQSIISRKSELIFVRYFWLFCSKYQITCSCLLW